MIILHSGSISNELSQHRYEKNRSILKKLEKQNQVMTRINRFLLCQNSVISTTSNALCFFEAIDIRDKSQTSFLALFLALVPAYGHMHDKNTERVKIQLDETLNDFC